MAKYWITKKEYMAGLQERLTCFNEAIKEVDSHYHPNERITVPIWYLGDVYSYPKAKRQIAEALAEINKISNDRTYRPWVEEELHQSEWCDSMGID
jgi:hypothetical protein